MMTDKVGMVMTSRGQGGEDDDRKAENGDDFDAGSDNRDAGIDRKTLASRSLLSRFLLRAAGLGRPPSW